MFNKRKNSLLALLLLTSLAAPSLPFSLRTSDALLAQEPSAAAPAFPLLNPDSVSQGLPVKIASSPSMRVINQTLKAGFEDRYRERQITVEINPEPDADAALQKLLDGSVDLAAIGRPVTREEAAQGLVGVKISQEKIAIIVGPDNPFAQAGYPNNLTAEDFVQIFRGEITNWSQLGGQNGPIRFIDRPENSDIRQALSQYQIFRRAEFATGVNTVTVAEDDTAAIVRQLGKDGVSYALASEVTGQDNVQIVAMHSVLPTDASYPYSQTRGYVYKQTDQRPPPPVQAFLGFATAAPGEEAVTEAKTAEAADVATADIPVGVVAVNPQQPILASTGWDGYLQLRDFQGELMAATKAHIGPITAIAFSPDGQTIATSGAAAGGADGVVKLWSLQAEQKGPPLADHQAPVTAVAFSSEDGQTLVSGDQDGILHLWNSQGQRLKDPIPAHPGGIRAIAVSPDGQTIATAGADQTLRLWDSAGDPLGSPLTGHNGAVTAIAFSPDRQGLPAGQSSPDQQIPVEQTLVSGGEDGTLRLWRRSGESVESIGNPFQEHEGPITSVAFSPNGQTIISASEDKTLRRWTLTGEPIGAPIINESANESATAVSSAAFSPDGQAIVNMTADGVPQFLDLQGAAIDQLPAADSQETDSLVALLAFLRDIPPGAWPWIVGLSPAVLLIFVIWWLFGDREWKKRELEEVEPSQRSIDISQTTEELTADNGGLPLSETPGLPSADFDESDFGTVSSEGFPIISSEDFASASSEDFATVSSEDFATGPSADFSASSGDFASESSEDFAVSSSEPVAEDFISSSPAPEKGAPTIAPAPSINKFNQAKAALLEGVKLARLGRYEEALDRLQMVIEAADVERVKASLSGASLASATALLACGMARRGNILAKLGRKDEAMVSLNKALELEPNSITVLARKAKALKEIGQVREAQTFLRRAAQLKSENTPDPVRLLEETILPQITQLTVADRTTSSTSSGNRTAGFPTQSQSAKTSQFIDQSSNRRVQPNNSPQVRPADSVTIPPESSPLSQSKVVGTMPSNNDSADIPESVRAALADIPPEIGLDQPNGGEVAQPDTQPLAIAKHIPPEEESRLPVDWPDAPEAEASKESPSESDSADIPAEVRAALEGIPAGSPDYFEL